MKKWLVRILLSAALVALGLWGWRLVFPSPEHVIRKQLSELAQTARIVPNEAPLAKLANSQKLTSFFTGDVQVSVDVPGHTQSLSGREELMQASMGARSMLSSLTVEFLDVTIALATDKESAVANLTAKARIPGEQDFIVQELKLRFKKIGGDWLINRVETVKTLL
ncbi:MAG TPA: hypothetical protein VNT26_14765 [Candidatus Sulfotelmatobacter sp.]|nr:hypothetical protein [Candidatus Sulfotelmatobacter sp.]